MPAHCGRRHAHHLVQVSVAQFRMLVGLAGRHHHEAGPAALCSDQGIPCIPGELMVANPAVAQYIRCDTATIDGAGPPRVESGASAGVRTDECLPRTTASDQGSERENDEAWAMRAGIDDPSGAHRSGRGVVYHAADPACNSLSAACSTTISPSPRYHPSDQSRSSKANDSKSGPLHIAAPPPSPPPPTYIIMGLCKCRTVTTLFCFEHRRNVCERCVVTDHSQVRGVPWWGG